MIQKISEYKFLFGELVKRDFILKYKRTVLGLFWSVLSPLMTLTIQIMVFNTFFGSDIPHYTIFLFSGNLVYTYFSEATQSGLVAMAANAPIFAKVKAPKYLFVFSRNISSLINFGLTFLIFLLFVFFDHIPFTHNFFLLIYVIACMLLFNCGMSLILSTAYMFFRDLSYLYNVLVLILMYVSAIFYSVDAFSPIIQRLFLLNPLYVYIKYFRLIVIDAVIPSVQYHLLMLFYSLAALLIGTLLYKKLNHKFLYYI
ncbi:MAG: ABC transporter permease [Agathobaculum sp.]|uniref:ABC transporter permease n=1 Tax=Agathobaculum sp. TaxID=2048138 RepID=UPI0025BEE6E7|nr:ABC transporter permease [Agathobaculum sp.]MCI7126439.1 ABC transporter permease [Agathobaculum sp.]